MNVEDIMTTKVITCTPDTPISDVLGLMEKHKIHQLPVLSEGNKLRERGDILGIITLNKIIISEVNPSKTKANAFVQPCPRLSTDYNLKKAAKILLDANLRALPVWNGGLVGMLSEQDIMQVLQVKGSAPDYARKCLSVDENDPVAKVKRLMVYNNISRVGIIKKDKLRGIVGTLDLLPLIKRWQRFPARSAASTVAYKSKMNINMTPAGNFMHGVQTIDYESSLATAAKVLKGKDEVLLEKGGEFYIITPKDLLKIYTEEVKDQLVQIAGIDEEDDRYAVGKMYESAQEIVYDLAKSIAVMPMKIYVKKHKKQGNKIKYSVKIELPTSAGLIVATKSHKELTSGKSFGDLLTVFQHALDDIERQARKHVEMRNKPERQWEARRRVKEGY
ncbi:MAG: CBS domain-containing protein [Candidatus Aenigmarchaeota archaeon]|nr:CBS domain-containing protein [Candidatus Aenigmarchaeota archaeon]